MSFAGLQKLHPTDKRRYIRKQPILSRLRWALMDKVTCIVKWPEGNASFTKPDGTTFTRGTSDPNAHYGPWLNEHIGKGNWRWWPVWPDLTHIEIEIAKSKEQLMTVFLLQVQK